MYGDDHCDSDVYATANGASVTCTIVDDAERFDKGISSGLSAWVKSPEAWEQYATYKMEYERK